jgi:hypothetical protein
MVKVELLYFDGCPGYEELRPRLERLLDERTLRSSLELLPVVTLKEAKRQRFLGSPTVRVDGRDVELASADRADFGMKCRLYSTATGVGHSPPDELIIAALERTR